MTDIAAFVWPAYSNNPATKQFWNENCGEWQSVISSKPKFEGHRQPRVPLWGYVDEQSPDVMEMEIKTALNYGVNVFIYDWYFYEDNFFLEECLQNGFLKAKNCNDMKFYLMYANHDVNNLWNKKLSTSDKAMEIIWSAKINNFQWERICEKLVNVYFCRENYYKINNKPVFMIYDLQKFIDSFGSICHAKKALDYLEKLSGGIHLQAALRSFEYGADGLPCSGTQINWLQELGFHSATYYHYVHIDGFTDKMSYLKYAEACAEKMEKIARLIDIPFIPHVSIGWDNNPRFDEKQYWDVLGEATKSDFIKMLQRSKSYLKNNKNTPPLITVNSWNEWTEGSYLMPDSVNGYQYLEAVREVFKNNG